MNYYTYNVDYNQGVDIGAQYHRIVSIYCLVKYLNSNIGSNTGSNKLTYVHNRIQPDPSGIDPFFGLSRFVPGKYGIPTEFDNVQQKDRPTFEDLQLFYQTQARRKKTILEIGFPEDVMKNHPEIYTSNVLDELRGYLNPSIKPNTTAFSNKTNIVVHIVDLTQQAYYLSLIDTLNKLYGMDDSNICIIASEEKPGNGVKTSGLDPYRAKKNVTVLPNLDFLPMFQYLSTANVLVMSPTSTSYLAALYTDRSVTKDIYYTDNVYPALDGWKNVSTIISTNPIVQLQQQQQGFQNIQESFTDEFVESYGEYNRSEFVSWVNKIIMILLFLIIIYFIVKNKSSFSFSWNNFIKSLFRIVKK